jgi:hypothetical protein
MDDSGQQTPPPDPVAQAYQELSDRINTLAAENQELHRMLLEANHRPQHTPEPKVVLPEKFSGKHSDLRNFLSSVSNIVELQPSRYGPDRAKTGLVGSLCLGDALSWYRTLQENSSPLLHDFREFLEEFKNQFGDPYFQENSRRQLLGLSQGKSSASAYASRFRRIASDTGFNDETLRYHFERGLSHEVRRAIAVNDQSFSTLDDTIKYAIKVDNRLFEFSKQEGQLSNPVRAPTVALGPVPMEIGSVTTPVHPKFHKLTDEEKTRRRREGLCLYCGQPGHLAHSCPSKQTNLRVAATETEDPKNV